MMDEKRNIEKSRIPWTESTRINKKDDISDNDGDGDDNDNSRANNTEKSLPSFDEEIFDDRQFYSLLLKVREIYMLVHEL